MTTRSARPIIAISMGDPAGIGPEICLHALADRSLAETCIPLVIGDVAVLEQVARSCNLPPPAASITDAATIRDVDRATVLDLQTAAASGVQPGTVSAVNGRAAYQYIRAAITATQAGTVDAVCTAPISKEALHAAGIAFPGHTEIFATETGATRTCMMFVSAAMTCSLVTTHVGYRDVPRGLSVNRIVDVIELTAAALRDRLGRHPRLTVCGLNPHAGEHGLFGDNEEERLIVPAIETVRRAGLETEGPLPPDTAFLPDVRARTDAYICMYHDQGLIPLKTLAFASAVNVTLGLPIVRTSVDHGTAFDIAGQGKANPESLFAAIRLAAELAPPRRG